LLDAHAAYLRHLGTAAAAEVLGDGDGVYAVRTAVASNGENGVLSSGPVAADTVWRVCAWFAEGRVPASWLTEDDRSTAVLEAAGCTAERSAVEMRAAVRDVPAGGAAGVAVEPVASERGLEAWLDVAGACGWFENEQERRALNDLYGGIGLPASSPFRLWLARHGDVPVGMAAAFHAGVTVLLSAVAVLPAARRRGIGRALALARLRDARDGGCETAVLAPSPDGAALYRSLGFETHPQPPDRWFYLPPPSGSGARIDD
jgi:GNAT superfamily N-acetyltransferase